VYGKMSREDDAQCTRIQESYGPISPDEQKVFEELGEFIVQMAMDFMNKEKREEVDDVSEKIVKEDL